MLVITVAAIVIGLVAVVALVAVSGGLGDDELAAVSRPDAPAPAAALRVGRSLGDPDAPVKIDVFEDPQCPACGRYAERIEPLLIAGPVSDGSVFLTYKDFPFLGPESFEAAAAMRVAEDLGGKFWDYQQLVFHNQQGENQGAFTRDRLADMAELVGLDREAFLAAMDDPSYRAAAEAEAAEGSDLGVSSTPSLFVNGEIIRGVPEWEALKDQIDAAASGSEEAG
ncbi:MAG TPA: thioredoxin domain-containing protein [Candidatus Limnocylindrales bacterium]|nr:thioredoxin domain-containing protein [Candidatus Limnocylindrales bacterium]